MYPQPIKKLISLFSKFPAIGPRSASRFVFYLLNSPQREIDELIDTIRIFKAQTGVCKLCFNPFDIPSDESKENLCDICKNKSRDRSLLCVVEKESDLQAFEKTKTYRGLYFILGGTVGQLKKQDIENIRIEQLGQRAKDSALQEIVLATNLTSEGETTALYLERMLKPLNIKITRLGRGLPIGGELEYADDETLRHAFENRR